jgi:hypothetical protein
MQRREKQRDRNILAGGREAWKTGRMEQGVFRCNLHLLNPIFLLNFIDIRLQQ